MERKEPSTSEVAHIGAELALFKGAICERAEISGAVLAPMNFKVAPVFFKFILHMVQFGTYNGVNSAPKLVPKTALLILQCDQTAGHGLERAKCLAVGDFLQIKVPVK